MDLSKLIPLALRVIQNRQQIQQLVEVLKPTIREFEKVAPVVMPMLRNLWREFFPDLVRQWAQTSEVLVFYDVYWVQQSLNKLINAKLKVDGVMGEETLAATAKFQTSYNKSKLKDSDKIEVDGWPGPVTCAMIDAELRRTGR